MTTDLLNDRIAIKTLIFTKALPNHTIPFSTEGYKIFPCIDCGDKFLFETSYLQHTNRKSLKIIYFCRYCSIIKIFYNRCKFLSHIRSHAFRTATINVSDIKLDPLPIEHFNMSLLNPASENQESEETQTNLDLNYCYECNEIISIRKMLLYKSRAEHYMLNSKKTYSCPLCLFLLPTLCALEAHLRIHLKIPPYFCPECGILLPTRSISYPFNHECEGFKMMKATANLQCFSNTCNIIFNAVKLKAHLKMHFSKVYKCSFCLATSVTKQNVKCKQCKNPNGNIITYLKCPICTNRLFFGHNVERHLDFHCDNMVLKQVYPCTRCGIVCENMFKLLNHCVEVHKISSIENLLKKVSEKVKSGKPGKPKKLVYHQVIKRCNKCLRSFTYRCEFDNIKTLPKDCPYKCSVNESVKNEQSNKNMQIQCYLCKRKISEKWSNIKAHFAMFHKSHKCLDLKVMITKIDNSSAIRKNRKSHGTVKVIKKSVTKVINDEVILNKESTKENEESPQDSVTCNVCNYNCENKEILENHMVAHRDPYMAYQCLECGQCFVMKPSFTTHLLLEHGIPDVQEYIDKKPCYNELAMLKNQNPSYIPSEKPVQENQCRVCREQFDNENELQKHFRVHGMDFLMKNSSP